MLRASRVVVLAAAVSLVAARRADAKPPATSSVTPPDDAEEQARALVRRGLAAFARGEPGAALADYQEASRLVPDANLPYRYAAEALVSLGRYEEAIASYEKYLAIRPDVSDADSVRARIAEVKKKMSGEVSIRSRPAGALVLVDDAEEPAGKTPVASLVLPRGPHTFLLRLDGHRDVRLQARLEGGTQVALEADLAPSPAPAPAEPARPRSTWTRRSTGLVVGGIGAAVLGTGFVLDATWVGARVDAFEDARMNAPAEDARVRQDEARTAQTIAVTTIVVGAVALAVGATLALWPRER